MSRHRVTSLLDGCHRWRPQQKARCRRLRRTNCSPRWHSEQSTSRHRVTSLLDGCHCWRPQQRARCRRLRRTKCSPRRHSEQSTLNPVLPTHSPMWLSRTVQVRSPSTCNKGELFASWANSYQQTNGFHCLATIPYVEKSAALVLAAVMQYYLAVPTGFEPVSPP